MLASTSSIKQRRSCGVPIPSSGFFHFQHASTSPTQQLAACRCNTTVRVKHQTIQTPRCRRRRRRAALAQHGQTFFLRLMIALQSLRRRAVCADKKITRGETIIRRIRASACTGHSRNDREMRLPVQKAVAPAAVGGFFTG